MYLKALEIQGFKSFPDKTVLNFGEDITAIVGPNGSGKSNISDAIRWVMGEQNSRQLRGAKMEDVIFGGTEKRNQMGFAQVTLVIDNTEHIFPARDEAEVAVTRRYYRSGESEYYINKQSVRLKDVNELYKVADYVTIHVPYNNDTKDFINAEAISKMKGQVRVLNLARGGLVNDDDMIEALNSGRVAKYVTDFPDNKITTAKNVIALPHLGASTPESEENCAVMAAAQTRDFLESGIIRNSVNLPAVDVAPVSKPRLFCIHENVPNVLGSITSAVAGFGLNISDLVNRSRGNIAVSVVDLDEAPSEKREALTQAVKNIAGMKRVRLLGV